MKKLALLALAVASVAAQAQNIVYDNTTTTATAGTGLANTTTPVYGDALNLGSGGTLSTLSFSLFNSSAAGTILTGTELISIYDNTVPYTTNGTSLVATLPLIASFTFNLAPTGGLAAGFYTILTSNDLSASNVTLPTNIFITQQFTQLTGDATNNGVVLGGPSTVGSSPNTFYRRATGTTESPNYTSTPAGGTAQGQVFYSVTTAAVPEPATMATLALGGLALLRRRKSA